jgi:hypothetical protein
VDIEIGAKLLWRLITGILDFWKKSCGINTLGEP